MNRIRLVGCLAALGALAAGPAHAVDHQFHGFATQAFLLSEGNNFFGNSTEGSTNFYEAGLNGSVDLGYGLRASAQVLIRDAGNTDDGKPRLDYALLDWSALQTPDRTGGIRLGRIKNAFGLFNDTRDLMFTRPGILMPSMYLDGFGLRSVFFSADGAQIYGNLVCGEHDFSLVSSAALNRDLREREIDVLSGGQPALIDDAKLRELYFTRLADDWSGGRVTVALSHMHTHILATYVVPMVPFPVDARLSANFYALSARYNAERFSLTGEYSLIALDSKSSGGGMSSRDKNKSDNFYLQADYRFSTEWSGFLRYDAAFGDTGDRNGSESDPSHDQFAHDVTIGGGWTPGLHWGIWAELHRIYGTYTAPAIDNPDGADDAHWTLFTVMFGYRF